LGAREGKRDGPTSGTEAFPVVGPRNGLSQSVVATVAIAPRG
jgi:hypothetical protein